MNKILCFFGVHNWEYIGFITSDFSIKAWWVYRCKRCGKKKKEYS